jgi:putative transposase
VIFHDPSYFEGYLRILKRSLPHASVRVLAYALMNNHVHIIAIPAFGDSFSTLFRRVSGSYSHYVNLRLGSTGKVWGGRYFSSAMSDRHMHHALRYVEMNPVRAGMVSNPANYRWTSAQAHYSGRDPFEILDLNFLEERGGPEAWVQMIEGEPMQRTFEIDHFLRKCTYAERPFGDEAFLREAESFFGRTWNRWPFERSLTSSELALNLEKLSAAG